MHIKGAKSRASLEDRRALSALAWGGGDPGGREEGCSHICSPRKGKGTVVLRRGTAWGPRVLRAKAGARCFLARCPGEVTTSHLKIAKGRAATSPFPALPRDQIRIFTSQPTNHFKTHKKYSCYERALWYPQGVLSCSHAIPWCPAEWELGERFLKAD